MPIFSRRVNIIWYNHPNGKNFGDELVPYMLPRLFNIEVQNVIESGFRRNHFIIHLIKYVLKLLGYSKNYEPKTYYTIGSILNGADRDTVIWGSGIIDKSSSFDSTELLAVRGFETYKRAMSLGLPHPKAVGDPALLLPIILPFATNKQTNKQYGIVPHYVDKPLLFDWNNSTTIRVIDLTAPEIESIVEAIVQCKYILSSSLHGIITAHAYGIPALWVKFSDKLTGDGVKFKDYFSSVQIPDYVAIDLNPEQALTPTQIDELFKRNQQVVLPSKELIKNIQENLLRMAPFPLKKQIRLLLK